MGKIEKPQRSSKGKIGKPQRSSKGKIGKPQRSSKHKKLKAVDPFYVGPRPVDKNASLYNKEPKGNDEDSFLPGSVRELNRLRQQAKQPGKRKRNKYKKGSVPEFDQDPLYEKKTKGMSRPLKQVPIFRQRDGESEFAFMHRMDRETHAVIRQTQLEDKYEVDIEETSTGEMKFKKRRTEEDQAKLREKRKVKNQKKTEKSKAKKLKKMHEKIENFEEFKDEVKFGETVLAPPTLTARPRKVDTTTNRPGRKSLLLKDLVPKISDSDESSGQKASCSGKRKHMSIAGQRIHDQERTRAIEMYRHLKKQKRA